MLAGLLWHGADAYYGRKANNKKADEGMITFSEAFWRGGIKDDMKKSQLEIQSKPFRRLLSVMSKTCTSCVSKMRLGFAEIMVRA